MSNPPDLSLATEVAAELQKQGIEPLLIGAAALAAHGFTRATLDLDFGIAIPPGRMRDLAHALEGPEREVTLGEPDGDDPLGRVITIVRSESTPVQVVNFDNSPAAGFPALIRGAEQRALAVADLPGKLVSVEDLVLFKLYAGGMKSEFDIVHLLTHRQVDLPALKALAKGYRLDQKLSTLLARVGLA